MLPVNLHNPYLQYGSALIGYAILAYLILFEVLSTPGTIGLFHDWFLGPLPSMVEFFSNGGFYIWNSQTGNVVYPTSWIIQLLIFPFAPLGGEFLSKGIIFAVLTLGGFGSFYLGRRLGISFLISFLVGMIYVLSPIFFTRIVAGHMYYLLAYSLSPLIVAFFIRGIQEDNNRLYLISAFLVTLAMAQFQFLPMLFITLLAIAISTLKKRALLGLFYVFGISLAINLPPIILSQLADGNNGLVDNTIVNPLQLLSYHTIVSASDMLQNFRLLGYEPNEYSYSNLNLQGILPDWTLYLSFLFPIVGYSSLILVRKGSYGLDGNENSLEKYIVSFAAISLLALFFLKGTNPPFKTLFEIPFIYGGFIFRELWHLAFLYSFPITLMIGFVIWKIQKNLVNKTLKYSIPVILSFLIIIPIGYPLILGNFGGYLQQYDISDDYKEAYDILTEQNDNVLVLPLFSPMRYEGLSLAGNDPFVSYMSNNIFSTVPTPQFPSSHFSVWLMSVLNNNATQNLGSLLSGVGVKYIILRNDVESLYPLYAGITRFPDLAEKWETPVKSILDRQVDLEVIKETPSYTIYENQQTTSKLFSPSELVGGLTDFNSLLKLTEEIALSKIAVHSQIDSNDSLVLAEGLPDQRFITSNAITLGRYADSRDPLIGWTDNFVSYWYNYDIGSRINHGVFSSAEEANITFSIPRSSTLGPYEIWLEYLDWYNGGQVGVEVNGNVTILDTFGLEPSIHTQRIYKSPASSSSSEVESRDTITLANIKGLNYLEKIHILNTIDGEANNTQQDLNTEKIEVLETMPKNQTLNLIINGDFSRTSGSENFPTDWIDPLGYCASIFSCRTNSTQGWNDSTSLSVSTDVVQGAIASELWSFVLSRPIPVLPANDYALITHMNANPLTSSSHIALEGFNETSQQWNQIIQCPSAVTGTGEWNGYVCEFEMPVNTSLARVVLNAGVSTIVGREAVTLYDDIYLLQLNQNEKLINQSISALNEIDQKDSIRIYDQERVSPAYWKAKLNASADPSIVVFAEPYDPSWKMKVYKDGELEETNEPFRVYGAVNGFMTDTTGDLAIEIVYARQNWYEIGIILSLVVFASCLTFVLYSLRSAIRKKLLKLLRRR